MTNCTAVAVRTPLIGGAGNDFLSGDYDNLPAAAQGDDTLDGGDGDDTLLGAGGNDTLFGGDGDDNLQGGSDDDFLSGDAGNDTLDGGSGNDNLFGGDGADDLQGGIGNDSLAGEAGNDTLSGGSGDDSYLFDLGGGQDTVIDAQGTNTLQFGSGITPAAVTFSRIANDLILAINGTTDQVTIKNWGNNAAARLAGISFADGTTWDTAYVNTQALSQPIMGTTNADSLGAWIGENTTTTATTMIGGQGDDRYSVTRNTDRVLENPDEGTDTVTSNIDYTLGANMERLTLIGSAVRGTGNELNNILIGNSVGNTLSGGSGNDILTGNAGNDYLEAVPATTR